MDEAIARAASGQHGAIGVHQLHAIGLERGAIRLRIRNGRLHPEYRGVYLVGHTARSPLATEAAALLAAGPTATLALRSAAFAGGWGQRPACPQLIVPRTHRGRREGLELHRVPLDLRDVRVRHGLRVTSAARTLYDLRREPDIEALIAAALVAKVVTWRELRERGLAGEDAAPTRSELERRLRKLIRDAGLLAPRWNVGIEGHLVDAVWFEQRLIVEVDGFRFHGHRQAFETDRRRDLDLEAAGWRVLRITWRQLTEQPLLVAARIAAALAHEPLR